MPEWVWGLIIVGILYDKLSKLRVFDLARGLIHLEFDSGKSAKQLKPVSRKKRFAK